MQALMNPKSRAEKRVINAKMRIYMFSENDEMPNELSCPDCILSKQVNDADLLLLPVINDKRQSAEWHL